MAALPRPIRLRGALIPAASHGFRCGFTEQPIARRDPRCCPPVCPPPLEPGREPGYALGMTYDDLPDEWKEWLELSPSERFARSEQMLAEYLAMGGSLDPDPDPTSPFDVPEAWSTDAAHGRAGLRVLRRGAG